MLVLGPESASIDRPRLPAFLSLQAKRGGLNKYVHGLACQVYEDRQTRPINAGIGTGERLDLAYPAFTYDNAVPGFAVPAFLSLQAKRGGLNKYVHGLACQVYEDLE
jgi:hypothetical protein